MNNLWKFKACGHYKITATGKLIYLLLTDLADFDGRVIVSHRKISNTLHISRSSVSRNLRRLERTGAIKIIPTYNCDGGRAANKYII